MNYGKPAPANDGCGTVVLDVGLMRKRIEELEAAIKEIAYMDHTGGIHNSYYPSVDLGELAPVLRTIFKD